MEEEFENIDYSNSNLNSFNNFEKDSKKCILSNLSISDDPIPLLINSPKSRNQNCNIINYQKNDDKKFKNKKIKRKIKDLYFVNKNIQKYNCSPEEYNIIVINNIINLKTNSLVATFKDNLIYNNESEFLRGNFNIKECIEVLPKFYDYYKNYLMFFCQATFNNFYLNEKIQEYGEKQAEIYYNNNYVVKKKKGKKESINDKNIDEEDESSKINANSDSNNETSVISFRTFFSNSVESIIKKGINLISNKKKEEKNYKELSSIKPNLNESNNNTIYLPDNSTISIENIITKKSSIKNIIDLMKNEVNVDMNKIENQNNNNENNLSSQKQKQNKKKGIIIVDKKKLIEGRNIFNRKRFNSFSKTTLNLFDKSKSKKKLKSNNSRINNKIVNNKKDQPNSNYLKYVGVLKQNKYIKINNIPKSKLSENDLVLSPTNNKKKIKNSFNKIPSFKASETNFNFNLKISDKNNINNINNLKNTKNKNSSNNIATTKKINFPLKIKNFYQKIKNINTNSNSSIQLSICKTTNNRNKSISKTCKNNNNVINRTNYNFNKKNNYVKKIKVLPLLSPKSTNNLTHNKSLSYSTINNCNININNNIILSNNYIYNNKYLCYHNSQKQINIPTNNSKNKSVSKSKDKKNKKLTLEQKKIKQKIPLTSRNIRINLDKFRTDENFLNSLMSQGNASKTLLKNRNDRNDNNIQYTSFRKSNNKESMSNKNRNIYKTRKISNRANKNLILKDVLNMNKTKSTLNKNFEYNSITKTYKTIYIKNNNNGNNQRKYIFEYKKKYI